MDIDPADLPTLVSSAHLSGTIEPVAPICPAGCPPAWWTERVPDLANATVVSAQFTLRWNPALGAGTDLRLQLYHVYPSGDTDIGKELFIQSGPPDIVGNLTSMAVPIYGSGRLDFVVMFAQEEAPGVGPYRQQAQQDFEIDLILTTRAIVPADIEAMDPPQRER